MERNMTKKISESTESFQALRSVGGYFTNGNISTLEKFFVTALALLYIISPLDIIPDVIPVLGWADDVGVGALFAAFCAWRNRNSLAKESSRETTPEQAGTSSENDPSSVIIDAEVIDRQSSPFKHKCHTTEQPEAEIFHKKG